MNSGSLSASTLEKSMPIAVYAADQHVDLVLLGRGHDVVAQLVDQVVVAADCGEAAG